MRKVWRTDTVHPDETVGEMDAGERHAGGSDSIAAYESHFATCPEADTFRRVKK